MDNKGRDPKQFAEYMREYRKKRKDSNMCIECNKKAEPGKVRCKKHLEYYSSKQRSHESRDYARAGYYQSEEFGAKLRGLFE